MVKTNISSWLYLVNQYNKLVRPPSRPCQQQLVIWQKVVKKYQPKKNGQALILGATPGLRDLALKNGYFTWAIDINSAMMKEMTKLMKRADPKKEKRLIANWCQVKLPKNYFDLIMADGSLNNVLSAAGNQKVLKLIAQSLKPQGICLLREIVTLPRRQQRSLNYWLKLITSGKFKSPPDFMILVRVNNSTLSLKLPGLVDSVKVYKDILACPLSKNQKVKKFLDYYYLVVGKKPKYFFIYLKSDFEKLLRKYFKILPVGSCREHYSCQTIFPAYLLKLK